MSGGVYLERARFPSHLRRGADNMRRSHAAGAAPLRPEVDEHRRLGVLKNFVEERGVGGDRFVHRRKRLFAGPASSRICKMRGWDPVLRSAVRTSSNDWHSWFS